MLALIAKVNCRSPLSGMLVAQVKRTSDRRKNHLSSSDDEHVGLSYLASGSSPITKEADNT